MVGTGIEELSQPPLNSFSSWATVRSGAADLVSVGRLALAVTGILVTQGEQALGYAGLHGDGGRWQRGIEGRRASRRSRVREGGARRGRGKMARTRSPMARGYVAKNSWGILWATRRRDCCRRLRPRQRQRGGNCAGASVGRAESVVQSCRLEGVWSKCYRRWAMACPTASRTSIVLGQWAKRSGGATVGVSGACGHIY